MLSFCMIPFSDNLICTKRIVSSSSDPYSEKPVLVSLFLGIPNY